MVREAARVARNAVISVAESRDGIDLRARYREMRTRLGYPSAASRRGEQGLRLAGSAGPRRRGREDGEASWTPTRRSTTLRQRGQSITWGVPEEVHLRIIDELQASYGGRTFQGKGMIELLVWSPDQLAAVASRGDRRDG